MADVDVSLDGATRFAASVVDAGHDLVDLDQVNQDAGDLVIGSARVPRRTGALASTVRAIGDAGGVTLTAGGADAPYAPYVHARDPFLTDALTAREGQVVDLYIGHVEDAVDRIQGV